MSLAWEPPSCIRQHIKVYMNVQHDMILLARIDDLQGTEIQMGRPVQCNTIPQHTHYITPFVNLVQEFSEFPEHIAGHT